MNEITKFNDHCAALEEARRWMALAFTPGASIFFTPPKPSAQHAGDAKPLEAPKALAAHCLAIMHRDCDHFLAAAFRALEAESATLAQAARGEALAIIEITNP